MPVNELATRDLTTQLAPFAKVYSSSTSDDADKNDILWQVLKRAHEASNLRALKPLLDELDSKLKSLPNLVIETLGDRDIVEGQPCALFSNRVADFKNFYVTETANSKKLAILSRVVQTLRDEKFRFLKRVQGGGFQEVDNETAMEKVRKKLLMKVKSRTVVDVAPLPLERGQPVDVPDEWHILPGCSKKHPANIAYRRKLSEVLYEFLGAQTKEEETEVCARVIAELEGQGFKFVDQESRAEMGGVKAIQKVKRSLRDMARKKKCIAYNAFRTH